MFSIQFTHHIIQPSLLSIPYCQLILTGCFCWSWLNSCTCTWLQLLKKCSVVFSCTLANKTKVKPQRHKLKLCLSFSDSNDIFLNQLVAFKYGEDILSSFCAICNITAIDRTCFEFNPQYNINIFHHLPKFRQSANNKSSHRV